MCASAPQVGPEFAFIGHSNVGKSSLLNLITGSKDLAKVSKRPGLFLALHVSPFHTSLQRHLLAVPLSQWAPTEQTARHNMLFWIPQRHRNYPRPPSAGKTTCINHFLINYRFYLVDCPGYGWV